MRGPGPWRRREIAAGPRHLTPPASARSWLKSRRSGPQFSWCTNPGPGPHRPTQTPR